MEIKYNKRFVSDDPKVSEPIFLTTIETQIKPVVSLHLFSFQTPVLINNYLS